MRSSRYLEVPSRRCISARGEGRRTGFGATRQLDGARAHGGEQWNLETEGPVGRDARARIVPTSRIVGGIATLVIATAVVAGAAQFPLGASLRVAALRGIDDILALVLVAAATIFALMRRSRVDLVAAAALAFVGIVVVAGVWRSPALEVGLAQARQVVLPLGMVFAGAVLRDLLRWTWIARAVVAVAIVTALWIFVEELLGAPIVDPAWYYVNVTGGSELSLREGLPPPYFADGVFGRTIFRPGGPFLNAPAAGLLLGAGAFAVMSSMKSNFRWVLVAVLGAALVASFARGGLLIFALAVVVPGIWRVFGKVHALAYIGVSGATVTFVFLSQGNTDSHAEGLLTGFQAGLRHPFGLGFGTTGYQASLAGDSTHIGSESLLGLYFAWLGWPAIAGAAAVVFLLVRQLALVDVSCSRVAWSAIGLVLVAASSETASSLASTSYLWIVLGACLAQQPAAPVLPPAGLPCDRGEVAVADSPRP